MNQNHAFRLNNLKDDKLTSTQERAALDAAISALNDPIGAAIAHVEQLREAATDPARREWLHRLLGNLRKV